MRLQRRAEMVEADNRRMMQDTHSLRQTNAMLNERVQLAIKRAAAATDANKIVAARLSSVERERDAVRALISTERQRATDMSHVLEATREQLMHRDLQVGNQESVRRISRSPAALPSSQQPGSTPILQAAPEDNPPLLEASLGIAGEEDSIVESTVARVPSSR